MVQRQDNVNKVLDSRDDSEAINTLSKAYDSSINGNNANDPLNYYAYAQGDYANTIGGTTALRQGFSTLLDKTLYQNDTNVAVSADELKAAYNQLVFAKNEVVTNAEFAAAQETLDKAVIGNDKGEFSEDVVKQYTNIIASLKEKLDEATITKTELTSLQEELTATVNEFVSKANQDDITNQPVKPNQPGSDSSISTGNKINSSVKTGDDLQVGIPLVIAIMSLLGIIGAKVLKRKRIEE